MRADWLRLLRSRRVGIATFYRFLGEYGSACAALVALPKIASNAGLSKYTPCSLEQVERELRAGAQIGAKLVCRGEYSYPSLLAEIPDAPPILWVRGNLLALTRPTVALVGARNASSLGTRMARARANELSEAGYVVVSGLARGIDTCADLAAAKNGSIAALAGGVDVIYPNENLNLATSLLDKGALLSKQPIGSAPISRQFPMRNSIISGLSSATVVVEAAGKSGSLITAHGALDQGRNELAVPSHPFDARASRCNMLIRDGALLVRNAQPIISILEDNRASPEVVEDEQMPLLSAETSPKEALSKPVSCTNASSINLALVLRRGLAAARHRSTNKQNDTCLD